MQRLITMIVRRLVMRSAVKGIKNWNKGGKGPRGTAGPEAGKSLRNLKKTMRMGNRLGR